MRNIGTVAHITRRFSLKEWGGTETVVLAVAKELERRGIKSPIFTTAMMESPGEEHLDGVMVRRFSYSLPWFGLSEAEKIQLIKKGGSPLSLSLFFALLQEENVSLIHTHSLHRLGGIARTVARIRKIPYVVSLHSGYFTLLDAEKSNMERHFKKHLEWGKVFGLLLGSRRTLLDADAIFAVGKEEYELCCTQFPQKKVLYLPNGITPSVYETVVSRHKQKEILCVSRIDPQKNQLLLVSAFRRFVKSNPEYHLTMVGPISDMDYFEKVKNAALPLGDKITIIPGLPPNSPELIALLQRAECFVLPSRHEPFGIVILEAWASHLPVLTTPVGGITGFTTGERNVLYFSTEDELVGQLQRCTASHALRQSLAEAGNQEVKKYSWESIVDQLVSHYGAV